MNYGYTCEGWTHARKMGLATRLIPLVAAVRAKATQGSGPYVEVDTDPCALYEGVRIRRITYLPDDVWEELRREADALYEGYARRGGTAQMHARARAEARRGFA